ncbi:MAG TPA: hypothetical protein VNF47_23900 [Streptosporangiaceae bacterium]|nr:hypothetical protein [Streptosporangiaceae bacterium]
MPPLRQPRCLRRPDDEVRSSGPDLLVAARAAVQLRRGGTGHLPDYPVAVRPLLGPRWPEPDRGVFVPVGLGTGSR